MRLLITAGPTREFIDSVRFISNPSSGKMGYALARAAHRRGHEVVLVSGPVALEPPPCRCVNVTTAAEMAVASKHAFRRAQAAILTAAVCDYRPAHRAAQKLAKTQRPRRLELVPTEDIATSLGARKGRRIIVAFAMEDHDHHRNAERKLKRKRCDAIVLNGPENVGSDRAAVEILIAGGAWSEVYTASKRVIATRIIRLVESLADGGNDEFLMTNDETARDDF